MLSPRVDYKYWLLSVVGWDGVLPLIVILVPFTIRACLPGHAEVMVLTAVFLPIAAFLLRFGIGVHQISANGCGIVFRGFQYLAFAMGVLILLCLEAIVIAMQFVPRNLAIVAREELQLGSLCALLYVVCMVFAWYPGSCQPEYDHQFDDHRQLVELGP